MKQLNFEIMKISKLNKVLSEVHQHTDGFSYSAILFHIYDYYFGEDKIKEAQNIILESFPDALIGGTSTNGDICEGHLVDSGMVVAVSIFESTDINVQLFKCNPGEESNIGTEIAEYIDTTANIKAAEILITLKSINSQIVLSQIEKCQSNITIFGGGSAGRDVSSTDTCVISNDDVSNNGVLIITYSGNDIFIDVHHAIGWKALGKKFTVTKIKDKRLYELDHIPAGKIYSKYLDIQLDENFFENILEFPLMSTQHGQEVLRLPFECSNEDNSILLAANMDEGTPVSLSYGDPDVIKDDVIKLLRKVRRFSPQAIFLYSCGVRRLYWKYLINKETGYFPTIAPVAGFYSSGEIMNMDGHIIEHHVTLIAISMREGKTGAVETSGRGDVDLPIPEEQQMHSQISMVRRLANFINVTASELMEVNQQLQEIADTDELTQVYNRRMLNRLIGDAINRAQKYNLNMILGIIDIDNFKEINDTYGHNAGDLVLKTLAMAMYEEVEKLPSGIFGRWGGEEFLVLAPTLKLDDVADRIEAARQRIGNINIEGIGNRTISMGVTEFIPGDTLETFFKRADDALYEAKNTGKDKICRK